MKCWLVSLGSLQDKKTELSSCQFIFLLGVGVIFLIAVLYAALAPEAVVIGPYVQSVYPLRTIVFELRKPPAAKLLYGAAPQCIHVRVASTPQAPHKLILEAPAQPTATEPVQDC